MDAPFGSWGTQTLIAGLTSDALIAPWVIKGAMDGPAFAAYIREVLVPEIVPGTVVILDNLATHLERVAAFQIQDSPTADVVFPCLEAHMGGANGQGTSNRVASAGRRVCG